MSSLKMHEKAVFEKIFDRGGYVLDFSDSTYAAFFREHRINIEAQKYLANGRSKMKRLRTFWEIEPDLLVGNVLEALLQYACAVEEVAPKDKEDALVVIARLQGKKIPTPQQDTEAAFINKEFPSLSLSPIVSDPALLNALDKRIEEIKHSLLRAPLATIFLCGSTLEGLLLDTGIANIQHFNTAKAAPCHKETGKVLQLHEWTLAALIDVAHELGMLSLDIKKHGHSLRDFRNYIHPRQQIASKFSPDAHTAKISWQVLQAAIADLSKNRNTQGR